MNAIRFPIAAAVMLLPAALLPTPAAAKPAHSPMQFFEGRTEGIGTIRIMLGKPYRTRSIGHGRFEPDGTMVFVQRVVDDGRPPRERRWKIRQIAPRRFSGTMNEALGPVAIEEIAGRFRFRFRMKGNLSVEQWLIPLAGGTTARNTLTIRKFGVKVGTSDGMLRKLAGR
jgi:Protein of unknown function (DUF3833)